LEEEWSGMFHKLRVYNEEEPIRKLYRYFQAQGEPDTVLTEEYFSTPH